MKKLLAWVLTATMLLSLVGCGAKPASSTPQSTSPAAASSAPAGEQKSLKIGMAWAILDDGQTNLTNAVKACFDKEFPDYKIEYTLTNADGDIAKLINDVDSLLAMNPDMIYIMNSVGDEGIIPAINACVEAQIPVGIGVQVEGANYTYLYEGFDQYSCGLMQAKYMESIYDEAMEYNVATITGNAGNTAGADRTKGFVENFVDVHDNAKVVVSGEGNWNTDDAQALAEDWLIAFPEINVIVCVNDDEAQGVVNACKAAGRDDVIILGIDGSDVGKANVESGAQACTVAIDFYGVALGCATAMVDAATGKLETDKVSLGTQNLNLIER